MTANLIINSAIGTPGTTLAVNDIIDNGLTINQLVATDGSKKLVSTTAINGVVIGGVTPAVGTFTTANATIFDTNVAAAGVTLTGTTLSADGTDTNISLSIQPKGVGVVLMGSTASIADFPATKVIISAGDSGDNEGNTSGLVAEASGAWSVGSWSIARGASAGNGGCFASRSMGLPYNASATTGIYGVCGIALGTHLGNSYAVSGYATGGVNNYSFYGDAGDIYNAGDIYTTKLTNSGITINGWAATPNPNYCEYEIIGKRCIVYFEIDGTSNSATTTITGLPAAAGNNGMNFHSAIHVLDGATWTTGFATMTGGGANPLTFWKNESWGSFSATGAKDVIGTFIYPIQ